MTAIPYGRAIWPLRLAAPTARTGTYDTVGIVTGVDQDFEIEDRVLNVIQTDAALNPVNSGGALFNENGEVIGINSAGIRSDTTEGLGFAISINRAKEVIDEIFANGSIEKASIGITSSTYIDEELAQLTACPAACSSISWKPAVLRNVRGWR